jgi:type VI secretion system protein ImpL
MRILRTAIPILLALIVWLVLAWFLPASFRLDGTGLWLLRLALISLGLAAGGAALWWTSRTISTGAGTANPEIDAALQEAEAKIRSGSGGSLASLPNVFLLGESNSAKTTVILRSGLEAKLLAGVAHAGADIAPTQGLNILYAAGAVFFDPGSTVMSTPGVREFWIHKLASMQLSGLFKEAKPAPRMAVVCFEAGAFLKQGAGESVISSARALRLALQNISHTLGVRLPVYVLFTKMDEIPCFAEFASNFLEREALEALGSLLPLDREFNPEHETNLLGGEFQRIAEKLCDQRLDLLGRERDPNKLRSIYEFPREFGKLRHPLLQFLAELAPPSSGLDPFLRGFYFTGVRPVSAPGAASGRRIPQWLYLSRVFPDVVLRDQEAQQSSVEHSRLSLLRNIAFAGGTAVGLLAAVLWGVSFRNNAVLLARLSVATRAAVESQQQADPLTALKHLEAMREPLARLERFHKNGHPWIWGLGLYAGTRVIDPAEHAYLSVLRKVLLNDAQMNLLNVLANPNAHEENPQPVYDALRAYLITTSHPEKSSDVFLTPVLLDHSSNAVLSDTDRAGLAARQYSFYAELLEHSDPERTGAGETSIQAARAFLRQNSSIEPAYQRILARVNAALPTFIFNQQYSGSANLVVNTYPVPGAFTRKGWDQISRMIQDPDAFREEEWVLGGEGPPAANPVRVQAEVQARYRADFVRTWREYLKATRVVPYANASDAASKLFSLSENSSPLTAVLCEASENTSVEEQSVAGLFSPPQQVAPPGCRDSGAGLSKDYLNALASLAGAMKTLAAQPGAEPLRLNALVSAGMAEATVRQLTRAFPIDKEGGIDQTTQLLLEMPIAYVRGLIEPITRDQAELEASTLCGQFSGIAEKYPFRRSSTVAATRDEVAGFFDPTSGALWRFYLAVGQKILVRDGSWFVPKPGANPTATKAFADFFSKASAASGGFFADGAQQVTLAFTLHVLPGDGLDSVRLTIGRQTAQYSGQTGGQQRFSWSPASPQSAMLQARFKSAAEPVDFANPETLWTPFGLFEGAENWRNAGSLFAFDRSSKDGTRRIHMAVEPSMSAELFQPGYFGFTCPAVATQ